MSEAMIRWRDVLGWGGALVLWAASGCSWGGPERVAAPAYDPQHAADQVLSAADADKDGQLSEKELVDFPSLKHAFDGLDIDGNQSLSSEELKKRIEQIVLDRVGSMSVACVVLRDGQPVSGVTVKFVPEPFVADVIGPAQGITSESGLASLASEDPLIPGVAAGFYRIELSLVHNGREAIPAKFNTKSRLGREITQDSKELAMGPLVFDIGK